MIMPDLFFYDENSDSELRTDVEYEEVSCSSALSPSGLPGLDYALNPYKGCEHGCLYCYSPSLLGIPRNEWGNKVAVRMNVPRLLSRELKRKKGVVGVGTVTDPYQPLEGQYELTRKCLEVLKKEGAPISLHTKSDLVVRDLPLIEECSRPELGITVTTIDDHAASVLEPNAPPPSRRIAALGKAVDHEVNAYALVAPVMPSLTDRRLDEFISSLVSTGVSRVMLDRFRLRPGMKESLSRLSLFQKDEFERLLEKIESRTYYTDLEERIRDIAGGELVIEYAFR